MEGYVKSRKKNGGMINSAGYSEQDCASIKYLFKYLDNGLEEISFETEDDFCIVLDNGKKIYVQVKVNLLSIKKVRDLLNQYDDKKERIFVGSGYDDAFRNLYQKRERYLNAASSLLCENKEALYKEIKDYCNNKKIDIDRFLECDFDIIDTENKRAIAKANIDKWARSRGIFVDTDGLFNELVALISNKLRTFGGFLTKNKVKEIIQKYRSSKIESLINKQDRASSVIEDNAKRRIEEYIDGLALKHKRMRDTLVLIKNQILAEQVIEATNLIETNLDDCPELRCILLMLMNVTGNYDAVIERIDESENEDECIFEYAKAYMCKNEYKKSQLMIEKIEKKRWNEAQYYVSAINHNGMGDTKLACEELKQSILLNKKFVEAYIFLASLVYIQNPEKATEYIDRALIEEPKYPKAYLLRAQISELFDDYANVVENYERYILYSGDDENEIVLLGLAINKFHLGKGDWKKVFCKWYETHRKNTKQSGTETVAVFEMGAKNAYRWTLKLDENELIVLCNDQEVLSYQKVNYARTAIGLYVPQIDYSMLQFTIQGVNNPIRKSDKAIRDEVALPAIFKIYDEIETYEESLDYLLRENVLHINHLFSETIKEYMVDEDDISIELQVFKSKLCGEILIGNVYLNVEIDPLTNKLDQFIEQLNKNCGFNEAIIILSYGESHQTQIRFPKSKINLVLVEE